MHSFFSGHICCLLYFIKIDFMKSVEINSRGFDQVDLASGETGFAFLRDGAACAAEAGVFFCLFFTLL